MIRLELAGAVATATLSRAPVNAIDEDWISRLREVIEVCESNALVSVLLIRSDQKAFSAGADLARMRERFPTPEGRSRMVELARAMQGAFARLERMGAVTIAEIGGAALGGGFELALACDLRIAAEESKIGLPEARLGLLPGAGGTQRLTRLAGEAVAKRLILGAEVVDGADAATLGLVHWAVPAQDLRARAEALAKRIAEIPRDALAACKRCISAALASGAGGFALELAETARLYESAETQVLVGRFLERE